MVERFENRETCRSTSNGRMSVPARLATRDVAMRFLVWFLVADCGGRISRYVWYRYVKCCPGIYLQVKNVVVGTKLSRMFSLTFPPPRLSLVWRWRRSECTSLEEDSQGAWSRSACYRCACTPECIGNRHYLERCASVSVGYKDEDS